jgi:foldase protein PrsA
VLSGPVKTNFGYYVFQVTGSTPGSVQSLAQAESSVKSQLVATQQQSSLSSFVKNFKKKWIAKTDCRSTYLGVALGTVIQDCKQYKAPKGTSGRLK